MFELVVIWRCRSYNGGRLGDLNCTTLLYNFHPVNLQHSSSQKVFSIRVENSVDPDQLVSSEAS